MIALSVAIAVSIAAAPPTPDEMATRVDGLVEKSLAEQGVTPQPICSDEDFLRRVSLDLAAQLPSSSEVTRFGLSPASTKRAEVVDRLAASPDTAARFARYWTEAIYSRATNARAVASRASFEQWMTEQLADGRPWDEVVTDIITATGDVRENGATGLIFAHDGDAAEVASEVSRLFTGIQMSCANCHDHPSDQWKRTDFHELAAYFPRVRVRSELQQRPPVFRVEAQDIDRGGPEERLAMLFRLDFNRDGKLTAREVSVAPRAKDIFERIMAIGDSDKDGALTEEEAKSIGPPQQRNNDIEHFMPDLNDPTSKGLRMQPVFFATDDTLPIGATDSQRRNALAESLTSSRNEWFAKSIVNRYWHEMVGEGFYMPVDDLGPGRVPMMPEVLDALTGGFQRNDYDVQWLIRTIGRTAAYQRSLAANDDIDASAGSAALAATRLDADQIYGSLTTALNVTRLGNRGQRNVGPYVVPSAERTAFNDVFGEDPSTPKADVIGSIPQALALMNSSFLERGIAARGQTRLADLLRSHNDNGVVATELYVAVLGREPNDSELSTTLGYVKESSSREEGFEDVYWALLNSAEFLSRR